VSIASVQERLPYIFLYASETGIRLPDEAMELHPSQATTNASTEYRIIELPYAQATLRDGERVLYSSASVMVVKRETTR
jgi:hypothetical protein